MANAVEKMFDMTLFNSLVYFPDYATNPDKFWAAIKELEEELDIEICVDKIAASPTSDQINLAKKFCIEFSMRIRKNPFDWNRMRRISKGQECIDDYLTDFTEFQNNIKAFFKGYVRNIMRSGRGEKVLYVFS